MNRFRFATILSFLISFYAKAERISVSLERFDCYGDLVRIIIQDNERTIDFYKFPEHLGFDRCEDALKFAANYTDQFGNLEGNFNKKVSVVNEVRCFGGQYGACVELPVKLEETQKKFKVTFFGAFGPENRVYYKYLSGCDNFSKYMKCN